MKIKYYGVRGSIPVSGKEYNKYGGNTTCVVLEEANTTLILDCGTGLRNFGKDLMKKGPSGHKLNIFISHYHWDHLMGFPFFPHAYIKGNELNIYGETKYNKTVMDVLKNQTQFINHPVELSGFGAKLNFNEIGESSELNIGPFKMTFAKINHPAGMLVPRIETKSGTFVFATDIEHYAVPDNKLINLAKDANILFYDAHFTPEEYPKYVGWGHSTYDEGIKVAQLAGVKELHLCHHAPEHNDDFIDDLQLKAQARYAAAYAVQEGWEVTI
ncbi:MAG TPA: MBL fold metallo-hydrolase [Candidatus Goldiibacteriota bacterium]|nr:MBL fold metallo-hydrolase [Candidatus Goldiibacteriota bacterium]